MDDQQEEKSAVGYLIYMASRLFLRATDWQLRKRNIALSATQLAPLLALSSNGPQLQKDLLQHSPTGQPALVAALTHLTNKGLIERRPVVADKRAIELSLTQLGLNYVEECLPLLETVNTIATQRLSPVERSELVRLLLLVIADLSSTLQPGQRSND